MLYANTVVTVDLVLLRLSPYGGRFAFVRWFIVVFSLVKLRNYEDTSSNSSPNFEWTMQWSWSCCSLHEKMLYNAGNLSRCLSRLFLSICWGFFKYLTQGTFLQQLIIRKLEIHIKIHPHLVRSCLILKTLNSTNRMLWCSYTMHTVLPLSGFVSKWLWKLRESYLRVQGLLYFSKLPRVWKRRELSFWALYGWMFSRWRHNLHFSMQSILQRGVEELSMYGR